MENCHQNSTNVKKYPREKAGTHTCKVKRFG
jgi:hypothetical protein